MGVLSDAMTDRSFGTGFRAGDTNYNYSQMLDASNTSLGFGLDLGAGISVAATRNLAFDLGADFHPATDALDNRSQISLSSEYLALHVGASLRI